MINLNNGRRQTAYSIAWGGMDEPPRGAEFARKRSVCSPPTAKADRTPAVDICHDICTIDYMNYLQKSTDFSGPSAANCVDSRPFDRTSTVILKRLRFPSRRTAEADLARSAGSQHVPGSDRGGKSL
jgi:hypothetical protein